MNTREPSDSGVNLDESGTGDEREIIPMNLSRAELELMAKALKRAHADLRCYVRDLCGHEGRAPRRLSSMVQDLRDEEEDYAELLFRVRGELAALPPKPPVKFSAKLSQLPGPRTLARLGHQAMVQALRGRLQR
jgi:hypothetical protein